MAKPRVKLKIKGIRKLMRSAPVADKVKAVGDAMAADAGPGFEVEVSPYKYGARVYIQTDVDDPRGRERQAEEHVLQRVSGRKY